jgi:regulatory protein YycI of two-component signal transduction system YycFG
MNRAAATMITPPDDHLVTAREALEPLYEKLELQTDSTLLAAAVDAGWSPQEATQALAALRLSDAMATLRRLG